MNPPAQVSLITGGKDKHYATGLAAALIAAGVRFDFTGSNEVDAPELHGHPQVEFFNLRGDQSVNAGMVTKVKRILAYYLKLTGYAATAKPKVFHILWNNKFEFIDRTLLMFYYRLLGKRVILTAHNINAGERDASDSSLNRLTLKIQYRLCAHIFVHTQKMKDELAAEYGVPPGRISVIPLGFYSSVPCTALTSAAAKQKLGLKPEEKAVLFFGNIAPYKGVEYLVTAFAELARRDRSYRLIIAGRPKGPPAYWAQLKQQIADSGMADRVMQSIEYIADEEIEVYFKAGDVLVQPYTHIFQSGVLILGMSFGIPVIASDVGSLKEDVIEGKTGSIFQPRNATELELVIEKYFAGDIYRHLTERREEIRAHVLENNSWSKVARLTVAVYSSLLNAK
ncbi:MAG TPA: glycosyltransferase family 4 protein [Verrucomicrobiae bacterium]|nr:glycosyltransferase family 4 protein [Verrucomicrobiae bacterium]